MKYNKKSNNKISLFGIFGILSIILISTTIVLAEDTQNVTQQSTPAAGITSTGLPAITTVSTPIKEQKFRVGPTVKIRPLNDIINKSADGIIEMYLDNPNLNDIPLSVEIHINVPSGIHIYGQGFGETAVAGTLYGKFSIPPGTVRTVYANIKAEKTGDFVAQLSGTYYPGDNKDAYQPLSLSHPFKVYEPSPAPESPKLTNPKQIPLDVNLVGASGLTDKILPAIIIAIVAGLIGLGYKIIELRYQHKLLQESKTVKSKTTEGREGKVTESETTETKDYRKD